MRYSFIILLLACIKASAAISLTFTVTIVDRGTSIVPTTTTIVETITYTATLDANPTVSNPSATRTSRAYSLISLTADSSSLGLVTFSSSQISDAVLSITTDSSPMFFDPVFAQIRVPSPAFSLPPFTSGQEYEYVTEGFFSAAELPNITNDARDLRYAFTASNSIDNNVFATEAFVIAGEDAGLSPVVGNPGLGGGGSIQYQISQFDPTVATISIPEPSVVLLSSLSLSLLLRRIRPCVNNSRPIRSTH